MRLSTTDIIMITILIVAVLGCEGDEGDEYQRADPIKVCKAYCAKDSDCDPAYFYDEYNSVDQCNQQCVDRFDPNICFEDCKDYFEGYRGTEEEINQICEEECDFSKTNEEYEADCLQMMCADLDYGEEICKQYCERVNSEDCGKAWDSFRSCLLNLDCANYNDYYDNYGSVNADWSCYNTYRNQIETCGETLTDDFGIDHEQRCHDECMSEADGYCASWSEDDYYDSKEDCCWDECEYDY
jgi:hypothetical protein